MCSSGGLLIHTSSGSAQAAGAPATASWIDLAGGLVDLGSLLTNGLGGSTLALVGRHEFDAAVVVTVVVTFKECCPCLVLAGKGPAGKADSKCVIGALAAPVGMS